MKKTRRQLFKELIGEDPVDVLGPDWENYIDTFIGKKENGGEEVIEMDKQMVLDNVEGSLNLFRSTLKECGFSLCNISDEGYWYYSGTKGFTIFIKVHRERVSGRLEGVQVFREITDSVFAKDTVAAIKNL